MSDMNNNCFALGDKKKCNALNIGNCMGHEKCPFYKTRKQAKWDHKQTNEHLCALPGAEQEYIAQKYYRGNRPWEGEVR